MSAVRQVAPRERFLTDADYLNAIREHAHRYVIRTTLKPGHRHTLDALIECADINGQVCEPMASIAGKHGGCTRTLQRHLPELDLLLELRVHRRPHEGPRGRRASGTFTKHAPSIIQLERAWAFALSEVGAVVRPVPTPRLRPNPVSGGVKFQKSPEDKMSGSGEISLTVPGSPLQISVSPPIAHARGAEGGRTAPDGAPKESRPTPTLPEGGPKPRNQSFEEAICIVRAAPGDRQILEESRARRHIGELRAALAASKLPMELLVTAAEQYARAEGPWRTWRTLKHGVRSIVSDVPRWTADLAQRAERARPPPKRRATVALRAMISQIGTGEQTGKNKPQFPGRDVRDNPASPNAEEREARIARFVGRPPKREAEPAPLPAAPRPHPPTESPSPSMSATPPELGAGFASMLAFVEQLKGKGRKGEK